MNKIIYRIGLLFFSLSIIFFVQRGMPFLDVLIRSLIVFILSLLLIGAVALIFMKAINQNKIQNENNSSQNK